MTTHFTSGVTNVSNAGSGGKLKLPDPIKFHQQTLDFDEYAAGDWTITTVEIGTGSATEALTSADGGVLLLTNAAADNDFDSLQWGAPYESYLYESGKDFFFKCRVKVNGATQSDMIVGLHITDTSPVAAITDGIYFLKSDGSTTVSLVVNKDSTATTTSAGTMADDTWTTLGFYYSSKDGKFYIYKDNKLVGTSVNTNAPDDEEIALSFTIQNGEAVVKTMSIDYLAVGKERTANTEL
jgi:hypothetical protein